MRPVAAAALICVLMPLVGCDLINRDNGRDGTDGDARATAGDATTLVDSMVARNRLPQRDYTCFLIGPDRSADVPYGMMGVNTDRYTLVVKGDARHEGSLSVDADRRITVEGDLAVIDGEVRRVSRARVNSEGQTIELAFDFAPNDAAGHNQIVCRAEA